MSSYLITPITSNNTSPCIMYRTDLYLLDIVPTNVTVYLVTLVQLNSLYHIKSIKYKPDALAEGY